MKQMVIHTDHKHTQSAVLENGLLTSFLVEPVEKRSLVGNIYKGIVQNVLPGMQAAFVDIGLSKNAFIYVDDLLSIHLDKNSNEKPSISQIVHPGESIIVQVVKDPIGNKGARVTTHYNLAGRWLVYMPRANYIGVSKKVDSEDERERLRQLASTLVFEDEGVILRTAAIGESRESLLQDVERLRESWKAIEERSHHEPAPLILHSEEDLLHRLFRDVFTVDIDEIWVSSMELQTQVLLILRGIAPQYKPNIRCYMQSQHRLITQFNVNQQVLHAFGKKIPLSNGGYLIWEDTEALTVIDVNTGKFVGHTNLEETLFTTNAEAAKLIARLLRIRDTGGIIIIDFIDMENEDNKSMIYKILAEALNVDRAKCVLFGWTRLGLMELTRKKTRDSYTTKYLQEYELK